MFRISCKIFRSRSNFGNSFKGIKYGDHIKNPFHLNCVAAFLLVTRSLIVPITQVLLRLILISLHIMEEAAMAASKSLSVCEPQEHLGILQKFNGLRDLYIVSDSIPNQYNFNCLFEVIIHDQSE